MASRLTLSLLTTVLAMSILNLCNPMIFSSSVSFMIRRYTLTVRVCPSLCARSIAWRSFMGFQSCSIKTTVSADVRLRPKPPTCVVRSKTSMSGSALNLETIEVLAEGGTFPSKRRYMTPGMIDFKRSFSIRSSKPRDCANTKNLWPVSVVPCDSNASFNSSSSCSCLSPPIPLSLRSSSSATSFGECLYPYRDEACRPSAFKAALCSFSP
mmetsp:Transcript_10754/g.66348  ORF Transcript_10754/g.66348 Transcript_10754/m.66348 type:complete len:211 (-) Transcript_10754:4876-5508(-)